MVRVGLDLSKQAFSSSEAEVYGYGARRASWQGPRITSTSQNRHFHSFLFCFSANSLPVSVIGITIIVCK